ncbi:MAG TPA: alginate lyase family protein [Crenotrichaceae bacterium]|nr:alginate lyase family protein [Crenotrichaceae bacterium]
MSQFNLKTIELQNVDDPITTDLADILSPPFARLSTQQLLRHFQQRNSVRYSPLVDCEHTEKQVIDAVLNHSFCFNSESYQLGNNINWKKNPSSDIEWLILLHKCYYFVGLGIHYRQTNDPRYLHKWISLTQSWIAQTEPGFIASDVTGRRIQNWIFAFYYFVHTNPQQCISAGFLQVFLRSLHQQVNYLVDNLTAARNHRTLELFAVFLAAVVFPEFRQASRWLQFSKTELTRNVKNDFLADGVHCELSTFYHHIVLKNLLEIKRLAIANQISFDPQFDQAIKRAITFSAYVHKPDGNIPSLSDGDTGCFLDLLKRGYELFGGEKLRFITSQGRAGIAPKSRSRGFTQSGYYILRSPWQANQQWQDARYLVFDCGPLGAGNHGHLDLLNIEAAAFGRSLIVDPGRYTYDESGDTNWRVLFRSTAYHNTVQVDGRNQSRYEFSPRRNKFKVTGVAAEAELGCFSSNRDCDYVHGIARSHEYSAIHERKIFFAAGEYWLICDYLDDDSDQQHNYSLRFHLSADAQNSISTCVDKHSWMIETPHMHLLQTQRTSTHYSVEQGFVSPQYGVKHEAPILRFDRIANRTAFETLIYPYKNIAPRIRMKTLDQQKHSHSSTLHCRIQTVDTVVNDYYFISHDKTRKFWKHGCISCDGSFCYLRFDKSGQLINVFALADSHITVNGQPIQTDGE